MNLLDENIRQDQEVLLRKWRVKVRRFSSEIARPGTQDADIIPVLHRLKRPTFFSHDQDFYKLRLAHLSYCLVWLDLYDGDAATFIRRFLIHPGFRTQAQRLGKVLRVHPNGIAYWETRSRNRGFARW